MDTQSRADDAIGIAGLVQALVAHYGNRYDDGERFADADRLVVAENRWLATRLGLRAHLVDAESGTCLPARRLLEGLLERVADDAAAIGAGSALERIEAIAQGGSSAERQLALHRRGSSLHEIVQLLVDETRGHSSADPDAPG